MKKNGSKKRNGNRGNRRGRRDNQMSLRPPVVRYTPNVFGFPDRLLTKLRYHDIITITSVTGALAQNVFRWNSTFDVDVTNAGHQPLYRDTYAAIYDTYAVVRAKATATFVNVSATEIVFIGMNTDDDASPGGSANLLGEQSHGQSFLLTPLAGNASEHTLSSTWDAQTYLNVDPFTSLSYKAAVGANPTEISTLILSVQNVGAASSVITVEIVIEQEVLWSELTTPTLS